MKLTCAYIHDDDLCVLFSLSLSLSLSPRSLVHSYICHSPPFARSQNLLLQWSYRREMKWETREGSDGREAAQHKAPTRLPHINSTRQRNDEVVEENGQSEPVRHSF